MTNNGQMLTEHFALREFTASATAAARGIENTPPPQAVDSLQYLCCQVLEPLRKYMGEPIRVTSGYRCAALNKAVGGVPQSQHLKGEAADLYLPNFDTARRYVEFIVNNCAFDQLLLETNSYGTKWLHVSCRRTGNRHDFKRITTL